MTNFEAHQLVVSIRHSRTAKARKWKVKCMLCLYENDEGLYDGAWCAVVETRRNIVLVDSPEAWLKLEAAEHEVQ